MNRVGTWSRCEYCAEDYKVSKQWQRYCSGYCRVRAHRDDEQSLLPNAEIIAELRACLDATLGSTRPPDISRLIAAVAAAKKTRGSAASRTVDLFPETTRESLETLRKRTNECISAGHTAAELATECNVDAPAMSRFRRGASMSPIKARDLAVALKSRGF